MASGIVLRRHFFRQSYFLKIPPFSIQFLSPYLSLSTVNMTRDLLEFVLLCICDDLQLTCNAGGGFGNFISIIMKGL